MSRCVVVVGEMAGLLVRGIAIAAIVVWCAGIAFAIDRFCFSSGKQSDGMSEMDDGSVSCVWLEKRRPRPPPPMELWVRVV